MCCRAVMWPDVDLLAMLCRDLHPSCRDHQCTSSHAWICNTAAAGRQIRCSVFLRGQVRLTASNQLCRRPLDILCNSQSHERVSDDSTMQLSPVWLSALKLGSEISSHTIVHCITANNIRHCDVQLLVSLSTSFEKSFCNTMERRLSMSCLTDFTYPH